MRKQALVVLAAILFRSLAAGAAERFTIEEWQTHGPLPASGVALSQLSDEERRRVSLARDTVLGPDATNPQFVKLWWFGVSSFIASVGGHLFLFDAWEVVGAHKDYVPIGRKELVAIHPEAILVGHGHFDHAADAGYVAGRTGALVVGSDEICSTAEEDAARAGNQDAFACLITGTMTTPAPGVVQAVQIWSDLSEIHILQHLHSASRPQDPENPAFLPFPNLLPFVQHPNNDPEELIGFLDTLGDAQGGTRAYHLRVGDFSLLWHDSAGPITDSEPGGPAIQDALDSFPGCVDVHVGAILGFDQPFSGLRDPRLYVEHAHPRLFLPNHHDAWAPAIAAGAAAYKNEWDAEMQKLPHPPLVDFLRDPEDYLKVRSYRVDEEVWKAPMPGSSCAGTP